MVRAVGFGPTLAKGTVAGKMSFVRRFILNYARMLEPPQGVDGDLRLNQDRHSLIRS